MLLVLPDHLGLLEHLVLLENLENLWLLENPLHLEHPVLPELPEHPVPLERLDLQLNPEHRPRLENQWLHSDLLVLRYLEPLHYP